MHNADLSCPCKQLMLYEAGRRTCERQKVCSRVTTSAVPRGSSPRILPPLTSLPVPYAHKSSSLNFHYRHNEVDVSGAGVPEPG